MPYFLPLPLLWGTAGAVIRTGPIRSSAARLDIAAAGPLAGLAVALPTLALGLAWSTVRPGAAWPQSILYSLIERIVVGAIPTGHVVQLHPVALAGWVGLLFAAIQLVPVGPLDGGRIRAALRGRLDPVRRAVGRTCRALLVVLVTVPWPPGVEIVALFGDY